MPITYLLVDFENVKPTADEVRQLRGDHFRLWIFRGPHQNKFDADMVEAWQPLGEHVSFTQSTKSGKNALDFHIAFCLGMVHRENLAANRLARYVVVSKDSGFDTLFECARSQGCHVTKAATIVEALAAAESIDLVQSPSGGGRAPNSRGPIDRHDDSQPSPETRVAKLTSPAKKVAKKATTKRGKMTADDVAKVISFLREQSKNRPSKRTTLEHHVVHILGNEVTEKVAQAVVDRLIQAKQIGVTNNKVEYRLSKT
ncbi:MAG: hypothetical protein GEV05_23475 [Betaproteobacteria bacterium]|nr:hypothetical protein [Betaproteobacteria bacterium]